MSKIITRITKKHHRFELSDLMPWILIIIVLIIVAASMLSFFSKMTLRNVNLHGESEVYLFIPSHADYGELRNILLNHGYVRHIKSFDWAARRMNYTHHIKSGKFRLKEGMSNRELIHLLRSGRQEPVKIILNNIRVPSELAGQIGHLLEPDSAKFMRLFHDSSFLSRFGVNPQNVLVMMVPNTYYFFWNITAAQFFTRMYREYRKFWQGERRKKCDSLGLSIPEVVTLASIVEKETAKNDEKPIIAGVYMNRLHRRIPLQADPTIIFAWNDYSIKRVLFDHLKINSPYNTYKFAGLPPGPICLPSVSSIDAVLNHQTHQFLYFCAKEDFSGYHHFAVSLPEHNRNARRYQEALNRRNIK